MLTHEERVEIILRDMDNYLQTCFDLNGSHIEHTTQCKPLYNDFWDNPYAA